MNKYKILVISLILMFSMTLSACGSQVPASTNESAYQLYAGFTVNLDIPFVVLHKSGEKLGVEQNSNSSKIAGAVWASPQGDAIVIYADGNGLPDHVVVGEYVLFYTNYTHTTVDVTMVHPGEKKVIFRAKLDTNGLNEISSLFKPSLNMVAYSIPSSTRTQQDVFLGALKAGLYLSDAGECIGGVSVGIAASPALAQLADACRGFILTTAIQAGKAVNFDVANIETLNNNLDVAGCQTINPQDCANVAITGLEKNKKLADEKVANMAQPQQSPKSKRYP
jgi:hypothetical protein